MGKTTDALANGLRNVQINWFGQFQDSLAVVSVKIHKNDQFNIHLILEDESGSVHY
jgi:hypothetical protein